MECPLSYQEIQDAYTVNRWDTGQHFCIRVTIPDGSVLLKVSAVCTLNAQIITLFEATAPVASQQMSFGVRECVTNEPQRASAGRLVPLPLLVNTPLVGKNIHYPPPTHP